MSAGTDTREERVRQAEGDRGDPDDQVWYQPNTGSSGAKSYHEDKDCSRIKGEVRDCTRAAAKRRWRKPCGFCCEGVLDE